MSFCLGAFPTEASEINHASSTIMETTPSQHEITFQYFLPHFFHPSLFSKIPVLAENITCYILHLWRIVSVIINKILQMIRTVTSSTFLKLFYGLECCLIRLADTCKFNIFRDIFLFCNFKELQTCNLFQRQMTSTKLLLYLLFFAMFHVSLDDAKHSDKQELKNKILKQEPLFVKMSV